MAFLYEKAEEFRELAEITPELRHDLRRLADLIERQADELRRRGFDS